MGDLKIGPVDQVPINNYGGIQKKSPVEFSKIIKGAIQKVNGLEKEADKSIIDLLNGKADVHETMVNLQKFDISMRLFLTIRNKAIEAYKEITRMQF
jgi:flagellar hook-basal body complex protein FliE